MLYFGEKQELILNCMPCQEFPCSYIIWKNNLGIFYNNHKWRLCLFGENKMLLFPAKSLKSIRESHPLVAVVADVLGPLS